MKMYCQPYVYEGKDFQKNRFQYMYVVILHCCLMKSWKMLSPTGNVKMLDNSLQLKPYLIFYNLLYMHAFCVDICACLLFYRVKCTHNISMLLRKIIHSSMYVL